MIDQARSPLTFEFERKNRRVLSNSPQLKQLVEVIADMEANALDARAKISTYDSLSRRLDEIIPRTIDANFMSQIESRQMLTKIREELSAAQDTIKEIR